MAAGHFTTDLFDPNTGTFRPAGLLTSARYGHAAALLPDGHVLVVGGSATADPTSALATAELYDPGTGTFRPTGSMTTARGLHTATLLPEGRVLVVGGHDGSQAVASTEIHYPDTGTFGPTGPWGQSGVMADVTWPGVSPSPRPSGRRPGRHPSRRPSAGRARSPA